MARPSGKSLVTKGISEKYLQSQSSDVAQYLTEQKHKLATINTVDYAMIIGQRQR